MAQDVISARSGLIHYFEGVVTMDGTELVKKPGEFSSIKEGSQLRTELGRAEVLLTPGVFVRLSENSSVRMVRNELLNTKLELTAGSILVEVGEVEKNQSLSMTVGTAVLNFDHRGLFRVDFDPAELKVHDGSAVVAYNDQSVTIREGKMTPLTGVIVASRFDKEDGDAFYRWATRRSGYISTANLSAAKRVYDRGSSFGYSNWVYNPYFGMFTYIPYNGIYRSPFGYSYYSPAKIGGIYYRPVYNSSPANGGWGGG